mmetsp:Transcript_73752/g.240195  ORF Transcript_73752/g.240195 Transcript_73752/m.240195 type:complete len:223 (+) Transcript_73752:1787-2455(+)
MLMANGDVSSTLKSRTLYKGDKIAACRAQPRATLSSWFMVVDSSFSPSLQPKASAQSFFTQGTREPPPTISTTSICSIVKPEAARAASRTAFVLTMAGSHILSRSSRFIRLAKSCSSMRHSTLTGASVFAERTFFVFMTASSNLKAAFLLVRGSQPCFFLNCSENARIKHSSNARPPTLSDFSQITFNFPRMNWTMETLKREFPIEQKATVSGFSTSKSLER